MSIRNNIATNAIKNGHWFKVAHRAWYLAAALALGIFLLSIAQFIRLVPQGFIGDERLAVSAASLSVVTMLLSIGLALVLFRRKPEDRMAMFLSYFLLAFGVLVAGPSQVLGPFVSETAERIIQAATLFIGLPLGINLLALFPDGRFVPGWTRWMGLAAFLVVPVILFTFPGGATVDSSPPPLIVSAIGYLTTILLLFIMLFAQIYRYRHHSTRLQKQQTKWFVYGFGLMLLLFVVSIIYQVLAYSPSSDMAQPVWGPVALLLYSLALAIFPITLTFAVMRYRLYDIDLIITRTLVYGVLTASGITVYALSVGLLSALFNKQNSPLIALLATGLVAVLFQPLRERLQRGANRLVYGQREDPLVILEQLGNVLVSVESPAYILPLYAETIAGSLKLPYVAIQMRDDDRLTQTTQVGKKQTTVISLPLTYHEKDLGRLNVSPQDDQNRFSPVDQRLLEQIATQTAIAVHFVRLSGELQKSRQQLVAAREEERRRLRRDLHDGLGPVLAGQGLKLTAARHLLGKKPDEAGQLLDEVMEQNEATVGEVRRLVYELRPPALDDLGLSGAIEQEGRHLLGSVELTVTAAPEPLPDLPAAVEVAAYRIVMEALTNVGRHAQATSCWVCVEAGEGFRVEIADDGIGISVESKPGVGLASMRERTAELGGQFSIGPNDGGGTCVTAILPC